MRARRKIEFRRRSPSANLDVSRSVAHRHRRMRQIGHGQHELLSRASSSATRSSARLISSDTLFIWASRSSAFSPARLRRAISSLARLRSAFRRSAEVTRSRRSRSNSRKPAKSISTWRSAAICSNCARCSRKYPSSCIGQTEYRKHSGAPKAEGPVLSQRIDYWIIWVLLREDRFVSFCSRRSTAFSDCRAPWELGSASKARRYHASALGRSPRA